MRGWAARAAIAVALVSIVPVLGSCATESAGPGLGSSRGALEALRSVGVDCSDYLVTEVTAVPYTQVRCVGLLVDWFADAKAYEAAVAADCAAVPPDLRAGMESIVIVKGPDWVMRGNGEGDLNAWPVKVAAPAAAALLDGQVLTAADYCRALTAW